MTKYIFKIDMYNIKNILFYCQFGIYFYKSAFEAENCIILALNLQ